MVKVYLKEHQKRKPEIAATIEDKNKLHWKWQKQESRESSPQESKLSWWSRQNQLTKILLIVGGVVFIIALIKALIALLPFIIIVGIVWLILKNKRKK